MPHLPVLTLSETLELFPAKKRKVYEAALESLSKGQVTRVDSLLSSFVKFEKQDVFKAPRIINPRSARYNLEVGCYLKHFEHHLFKAINKAYGGRTRATVIKGYDADAAGAILRSKWEIFSDPVAIGLDATKFDMHVSVAALKYEHSFYNLYWKSPRLRKLLSWQLHNSGKARCDDGSVEFSMAGTRCSGDVNTSLGNCIIMCGLVYAYAKEIGVDLELANNGDDCVVFLERSDESKFRERLSSWFVDKGFRMTVESTCYEFEEVEFCQTQPVLVNGGWRMIRNPFTCLKKDVMCLKSIPNMLTLRKWLYAVGDGGCALNDGVPILQRFYQKLRSIGVKTSKFADLISPHRFACKRAGNVSNSVVAETRASFYAAFKVLPDHQVFIEKYLDRLVIDFGYVPVVNRDELDIELPGVQLLSNE